MTASKKVNTNLKAAPSARKARKEEVEFINFEGIQEMKTVETTCKIFGACLYDENLNISCKACKQSPEVKEACQIMTGTYLPITKEDLEKKEKGTGTRRVVKRLEGSMTIKEFVGNMITKGIYTRKEIINDFLLNFPENNESQGGRYISSAFNPKYSVKRWGRVAETNGTIISWKA